MKPYFETKLGRLWHGDCLDGIQNLNHVDLVLTDPPYGKDIAKTGRIGGRKLAPVKDYGASDWDEKPPPPEYFYRLPKISKNQIIFGGNYFIEWLKNGPCWLVWDKDNTGNFADCELAWTSFDTSVRKFKHRWNGMLQECGGKDKEIRYHPTQKPVGLFVQILDKYSKDSDIVLDTHLGSGTTAIACERLGLKWIGIEISEAYCEIAAKRIEKENQQLKLF